jgi:hypothetical protein
MFLSETHLDVYPAECLRKKLNMDFKVVNPSNGRSGGVLLFWKKEINIQLIFSAPKYIDVRVIESQEKVWRFTGIYGEPRWEDKYKTWEKIRELKQNLNLPWIMMGDFNEILFSNEKEGGNPRPHDYMQAFRDALTDCGLEDIGYTGNHYTWKPGRIRERLDRAVANGEWVSMHLNAVLSHLEYTRSDHRPLLLDTEYQGSPSSGRSGPRRFEGKWLQEEGFRDEVVRAWEAAGVATYGGVLEKLNHMHAALHEWDNKILKKPKRRLRKAQKDFDMAMSGPMSDTSEAQAKESANLIEILLEQEEVHWLQRARANWLQLGDQNTSFFHNFASARRKKNYIKKLKINDDDWVEGTEQLKPFVRDYFANLFTSEVQNTDEAFLEKIVPKITPEMNAKLLSPF